MNNWQQIWNNDERISEIILDSLIKIDGFNSVSGSFSVDDWISYANNLYTKMGISKSDSIYEIGCGSGAFIYPLYFSNHKVGGIDYASNMINLANTFMPKGQFVCDDATNLDTYTKYDFIISHGVFQYFNDLSYAKEIIHKMLKKSNKKIAILELNDKAKKDEFMKIRTQNISKEEYEKRYEGLDYTFYDKSWFEEIGNEFNLKMDITDQDFKQYDISKTRFNVFMTKK